MGLRDKYSYAIQTAKNLRMQGSADERDGKLYFHGTVQTQDEANQIWDAIKSMALAGHGDSVWLVVSETVEELDALCKGQQTRDKDVEDEAETMNIFADILDFIEDSNL